MVIHNSIEVAKSNGQSKETFQSQQTTAKELSGEYKTNYTSDNAAGLAISERMTKRIRGLIRASENAQDGISTMQAADGAMAEIQELLNKGIELSVKAANGSVSAADRTDIQQELTQLRRQINTVRQQTKFNDTYVLQGDNAGTVVLDTADLEIRLPDISTTTLGIDDVDVSISSDGAEDAIAAFSDAIDSVSADRSRIGAYQSALEEVIGSLGGGEEDSAETDRMLESANTNIAASADQSMRAQANQSNETVLSLLLS